MLEAMAVGLPVVASQVSGTEDAIEDGRNGLLVPPGEPEALSDALRRLSEDPDLRERLGTEARKTVEGRFNINRVAEETLGFYRHLIGGSKE
jgi:glycosyltransferase involved in cell wall biosynthesis